MKMFKATRVTIIAEKLFQNGITGILETAGATGYSFFEGEGKGARSSYPAHRPTLVDDFSIVKIETVVKDRETAEDIAATVAAEYFTDNPGVVYLQDVDVMRPEKF